MPTRDLFFREAANDPKAFGTAMSSKLYRQKDKLRADVVCLATACPFDQSNPADCPLFRLRQMKPARSAEWIDALPENDLVYLAAYHHVCFATRTEAPPLRLSL